MEEILVIREKFDKSLAWNSSLDLEDYVILLSPDSLRELKEVINEIGGELRQDENQNDFLSNETGGMVRAEQVINPEKDLPHLREQIESSMHYLDVAPGLFTLRGINEDNIPKDRWMSAYRLVAHFVGEITMQDGHTLEVKTVKDRGKSLNQEGARYSDGKHDGGGFLHTDHAERPLPVADYFGLMYINGAPEGGKSLAASRHAIHNLLLRDHPEELKVLYGDFHFDRRGDSGPNGEKTAEKPIFSVNEDGQLVFSYFKQYIEKGHEIEKIPFTRYQISALEVLENYIRIGENPGDNPLIAHWDSHPGDMTFYSNFNPHGRTAFKNWDDMSEEWQESHSPSAADREGRKVYRSWLTKKINTNV